ncbi:MAG: hypothetical protein LUH07_02225 [Lachnospiraceae bacterium]|nr:hypothetical protein [Lachnospiraceae bacterium]
MSKKTQRIDMKNISAIQKTLRQILMFIAFLLIVTAVMHYINYGDVDGGITFSGTGIQIEIPDGTVYDFAYSDILDISLEAMPDDLGTCINGDQARAFYCGIWENETRGTCVLYLDPTLSSVIVMEIPDQTIVINYENDDTTSSLYQAILDAKEAEN